MTNVFESPWLLLSISLFVLVVVALIRQSNPDKGRYRLLLLPVAIAVVAIVLWLGIKTDKQKIETLLKNVRNAIVAEDADRLGALLAEDYCDRSHRSKAQLIARMRSFFRRTKIAKAPRRQRTPPDITGNTATVETLHRVHLESNSTYSQAASMYFVKTKFYLEKTEDGRWQFVRTELKEVNFQPFHWGDL
jgi:ketosteroid isomerase-like protein